ncbi:MAG TPA: NAD(P)H-dependent oxidoreductase [Aquaticitalea sp.]|nr:NAD(P)H-dependent oxidoreductase [Aquaticitalea sp.]
MKNILVFAGSNSSDSINKQLAIYAASLVENSKSNILDLNDVDLPIYSKDLESEKGIPENAKKFFEHIKQSDGIVLSLAENNGAYSAVFKNLFDWLSRLEKKTFLGKPMLLMATSPGGRGGASVLAMAHSRFPYHDAKIAAEFSLPLFNDKFSDGKIIDSEFDDKLKEAVELFQKEL